MGDLNYFIKNATPIMWLLLLLIALFFTFLFWKFVKRKSIAFVLSLLFYLSLMVWVAYFGIHPILSFLLLVFWFVIFIAIAITRMSKEQKQAIAEQNDQKGQKKNTLDYITCPNCNSKDVEFMQNNKKSFSVGKAAAGAALTGGVGTLAGFAGKKGNNQWHCKQCGNVFETKK